MVAMTDGFPFAKRIRVPSKSILSEFRHRAEFRSACFG